MASSHTIERSGQALPEAMDDEQQLIGPLQAVADDAFTMAARPARLRPLLAWLETKLTSHLAHEEADALPEKYAQDIPGARATAGIRLQRRVQGMARARPRTRWHCQREIRREDEPDRKQIARQRASLSDRERVWSRDAGIKAEGRDSKRPR